MTGTDAPISIGALDSRAELEAAAGLLALGRGIAQALEARTLAWGRPSGATALVTQVDAGNAAMLRVSERLGFERVGGVRTLERLLDA